MGPPGFVKVDPLSDDTGGLLLRVDPMTVQALLFKSSDNRFNRTILLRTVRRDELLTNAVAGHHPRVRSRRDNQPVVRPQEGTSDQCAQSYQGARSALVRGHCRRREV